LSALWITVLVRCLLVALFLPFSALDKILNFGAAVDQAAQAAANRSVARLLILLGLGVEVLMSSAILTGIADRLAALVLAGYCLLTAALWKQFWRSSSHGRDLFWDFLKNCALAGGFLLLAFGGNRAGVERFWEHPLASSDPYASTPLAEPLR
jgi:putative oxidoreductase